MSLDEWASNGWIKSHGTSSREVVNLLGIVDRDLLDASRAGVSADWRFGIAYNAALKLCAVLLNAEGYRAVQQGAHYYTIRAMPLMLGRDRETDADYLDACRKKRNILEYDYAGGVNDAEVEELISFVRQLRSDVIQWLKQRHPELVSA